MRSAIKPYAINLSLLFLLNCGYHRLDRVPGLSSKNTGEIRVSIQPFEISCPKFEYEGYFRQALEARVISATTWKLVPIHQSAKWVFHGFVESCEIHTVGFLVPKQEGSKQKINQSNPDSDNGPIPFRSEIRLRASIELRDWQTGEPLFKMPSTTFSCQSNITPNGISTECIRDMAEDLVDSFFANLVVNGFDSISIRQKS